jgi:hypothetical protein
MAVAVETRIRRGSQADHHAINDHIEDAIGAMGGPPAGLMVHFARPEGDGFVIVDIWRTEAEMRAFYDSVLQPALAAAALPADPPTVSPVWGFARP